MNDEFRRAMNRINVSGLTRFDQELQEVRIWYDDTSQDKRVAFREWLSELAGATAKLPPAFQLQVRIHVHNAIYDENDKPVYEGRATITPRAMLKAVEAWDRGEGFSPNSLSAIL